VITPKGEGKVVDIMPMSNKVVVQLDNEENKYLTATFEREELQPWDELETLRRKAAAPCDRHEGGGCTCGKSGNRNS